MSIPDPVTILSSLSYDELSASILASLAVGLSDGKVSGEELQEITNIIHKMTGFRLGHDEVWAITLAGWHLVNLNSFDLAREYLAEGMPAYVRVQQREFAREHDGYTAARHQREAGTGYFDELLMAITGGATSTAALEGSTEIQQFVEPLPERVTARGASPETREISS